MILDGDRLAHPDHVLEPVDEVVEHDWLARRLGYDFIYVPIYK